MAQITNRKILFCACVKVIKTFKQTEDNSVRAIAAKLKYKPSRVNTILTWHLTNKNKRIKI